MKRGLVLCSDVSTTLMILWLAPPWKGALNVQLHPSIHTPSQSRPVTLHPVAAHSPHACSSSSCACESWTPRQSRDCGSCACPLPTLRGDSTSPQPHISTLTSLTSVLVILSTTWGTTHWYVAFFFSKGTEQCNQLKNAMYDTIWGEEGVILKTPSKYLNSLSHQKFKLRQFSSLGG